LLTLLVPDLFSGTVSTDDHKGGITILWDRSAPNGGRGSVLVWVRILEVINARKLTVSSRRFVQVSIEDVSAELTICAVEKCKPGPRYSRELYLCITL
jgi:hypothetical protein